MSTVIPPHFLRDLREKPLWKVCEAFCPKSFSGLNTLALLSERVDSASRYLRENRSGDQNEATESRLRSVVVFGERDPLGRGYKDALLCVIGKNNMADWALDGIMLENAGHYPMEDKPEDVGKLITSFA
jgi:pimeloyl-ACP methyl ester carboxylesterase